MLHLMRKWDETNTSILYLELDLAWCCSMVDGDGWVLDARTNGVAGAWLELGSFSLDVSLREMDLEKLR
ncbi:hypothetical protein TNCV_2435671 [Trichonephila clavipes]|nr:hypothetical protein TNCV_2435671 [Trichonephila clavipes]